MMPDEAGRTLRAPSSTFDDVSGEEVSALVKKIVDLDEPLMRAYKSMDYRLLDALGAEKRECQNELARRFGRSRGWKFSDTEILLPP